MSVSLPLKAKADVREATCSASMPASALMISSVIPSLKYSASAPVLMLRNGSTAIEATSDVSRAGDRRGGAGAALGDDGSRWSANARSRADWNRSSGLFSRLCRTISESSAGTPRPADRGGSVCRTAIIVSTAFSPWKARTPVSIS